MVYGMFFLGQNFVSGLLCTLKSKKTFKKPLKNFFEAFKNLLKTKNPDGHRSLDQAPGLEPLARL